MIGFLSNVAGDAAGRPRDLRSAASLSAVIESTPTSNMLVVGERSSLLIPLNCAIASHIKVKTFWAPCETGADAACESSMSVSGASSLNSFFRSLISALLFDESGIYGRVRI